MMYNLYVSLVVRLFIALRKYWRINPITTNPTITIMRYWKFNTSSCHPFLNVRIKSISMTWMIKISSNLFNFVSCFNKIDFTIWYNKPTKMTIPRNIKNVGKIKFHKKLTWSFPSKTISTNEAPDSTSVINGCDNHFDNRNTINVKASPTE